MKYLILALFLLTVSCKDDKSKQSNIGKKDQGIEVLNSSPKTTPKFKCDDENQCIESIVLVEDGKNFCQGVVKDGEVFVANNCASNFKCETTVITDTNNNEFFCADISVDNELLKIRTKNDISALNAEVAVLSKDDLTLKAYKLAKVGERYQQEFALCSITLSSFKALASTKLNSLFLAIKDCDQLPIGSILFQDEKLVSISTQSDILNLSQSLVCGEDCDSREVDKLEFMIDEITAKTKVKNLRILQKGKMYNTSFMHHDLVADRDEIIAHPRLKCISELNTASLNTFTTVNILNIYHELESSSLKLIKKEYIHTDRLITLQLLGNAVLKHSLNNTKTTLGLQSNKNLVLLEDLKGSILNDHSIFLKKVEVPYCDTSNSPIPFS